MTLLDVSYCWIDMLKMLLLAMKQKWGILIILTPFLSEEMILSLSIMSASLLTYSAYFLIYSTKKWSIINISSKCLGSTFWNRLRSHLIESSSTVPCDCILKHYLVIKKAYCKVREKSSIKILIISRMPNEWWISSKYTCILSGIFSQFWSFFFINLRIISLRVADTKKNCCLSTSS